MIPDIFAPPNALSFDPPPGRPSGAAAFILVFTYYDIGKSKIGKNTQKSKNLSVMNYF